MRIPRSQQGYPRGHPAQSLATALLQVMAAHALALHFALHADTGAVLAGCEQVDVVQAPVRIRDPFRSDPE